MFNLKQMKNKIMGLIMSIILLSCPAFAEDTFESQHNTFVDPKRTEHFLDTLTSTTRDTGKSKSYIGNAVKMALDIRLPKIFESCDLKINYEVLRLAYAYVAEVPGAENQLKNAADALVRKKEDEFHGVTPSCRAALKGFAVALLQVYLGNEWNATDEQRLQKALNQ